MAGNPWNGQSSGLLRGLTPQGGYGAVARLARLRVIVNLYRNLPYFFSKGPPKKPQLCHLDGLLTTHHGRRLRKENSHFSTGLFTALVKKSGARDELRNYEGHKLEFDRLNPQKYDKIDLGDIQ